MKGDILSLKLDNKDAKQERAEMMRELKSIHRSLLRLDETSTVSVRLAGESGEIGARRIRFET